MIQCFKDKLVYVEVLFFLTLLVYTVQHIMVFGAVKVRATFYYVGHVAMGCYVTLL